MGIAVGNILPLAVGVALSHGAIIVVLLLLTSQRARQNSLAFMLGWLGGLILIGGIALALASTGHLAERGNPAIIAAALKILLGCLLFFLAGWQWKHHPVPDEAVKLPKALAALDTFTPSRAFLLGAFFAGATPKNVSLNVSAALDIARVGLRVGPTIGVFAIFLCLASLLIVTPVIFSLVSEARATRLLMDWKTWLIKNHQVVQGVVLLIMGSLLIGKGISELSGG